MKKLIPSYVRVPLIFAIVFIALEYFIDSGNQPAFIKYPMVTVFLGVFLFFLIALEVVMAAVDKVTYNLLSDEQKKQLDQAQSLPFTESAFYKNIMSKLTRSKDVESEKDLVLDHEYDGIRELDNVLPPWWVYLFYATILFSFIYIIRYQFTDGNKQDQEYTKEVELAKLEQSKNPVKEEVVTADKVTLLTDTESLAKGKTIFANTCAACHRADGGGTVGPNLTDDHWINGGGIKNVFTLISEGSKNNPTMVAWKSTLKPKEIQSVASYVLSLQGTKPAGGKPAEGEVWVEETAVVAPAAGAAAKPADTVKAAPTEAAAK